jgi:uncharacterized SAM-binding protein YcdF (DUF218 family)
MILTGGNPHSARPEAVTMAQAAAAEGIDAKALILESESRSTWENVKNTLRFVPPGAKLLVASDATHARRALSYVCAQSADVCPRASAYTRWEPGAIFWYRWRASYYNVFATRRDALRRRFSGKLEW